MPLKLYFFNLFVMIIINISDGLIKQFFRFLVFLFYNKIVSNQWIYNNIQYHLKSFKQNNKPNIFTVRFNLKKRIFILPTYFYLRNVNNKALKIYNCQEIIIFIMYLAEYNNLTAKKIKYNIFAHIQI